MVIFTADPQLRKQTIQSFEQEASMLAVLNHPAVTTVIPGAKNPDQVREHVRAIGREFSADEKVVLDRA